MADKGMYPLYWLVAIGYGGTVETNIIRPLHHIARTSYKRNYKIAIYINWASKMFTIIQVIVNKGRVCVHEFEVQRVNKLFTRSEGFPICANMFVHRVSQTFGVSTVRSSYWSFFYNFCNIHVSDLFEH